MIERAAALEVDQHERQVVRRGPGGQAGDQGAEQLALARPGRAGDEGVGAVAHQVEREHAVLGHADRRDQVGVRAGGHASAAGRGRRSADPAASNGSRPTSGGRPAPAIVELGILEAGQRPGDRARREVAHAADQHVIDPLAGRRSVDHRLAVLVGQLDHRGAHRGQAVLGRGDDDAGDRAGQSARAPIGPGSAGPR